MNEGDKVMIVKGRQRGMTGKVVSDNGDWECGGEPAVYVALEYKKGYSVTFFPKSYVVVVK